MFRYFKITKIRSIQSIGYHNDSLNIVYGGIFVRTYNTGQDKPAIMIDNY